MLATMRGAMVIGLTIGLAHTCAWAENPHPRGSSGSPSSRFAAPLAIHALRVNLEACAPELWESEEGKCLSVDLLVARECAEAGSTPCLDGASYPLDGLLAERIALDFGEHARPALRAIQGAIERAGISEEEELKRAAGRAARRLARHVHYQLLPHVALPADTELAVSRLAERYFARARSELVITSGPRTPESQAAAMYLKLITGGRGALRRLYRNTEAAHEIKRAYDLAAGRRKRYPEIVAAMAAAIRLQMAQGVFISPHLKGGAVDIRSRTMNARAKAALRDAVATFPGMRLIREEKTPPHFHLELASEEPASAPAKP
jgi:hypothetical protein